MFSLISAAVWPGWTCSRRKRARALSKANCPRPVSSVFGPPGRNTLSGLVPGADMNSTRGTSTRRVCSGRNRMMLGIIM